MLAGASLLAATGVTPASAGAPSVARILRRARNDMLAAGSVHLVVQVRGARQSTIVADIGRAAGRETYRSGSAMVTVLITATAAYVGGNATGLRTLVGLTPAQVRRVGRRFVEMRAGTSQYSGFAANLTVVALAGLLPHGGGITARTTGTGSVLLSWKSTSRASGAASSQMTLAVGTRVLPTLEVVRSAAGGGSTHFSRWGRPVVVEAPPAGRTIADSAVSGSPA